MPKLIRQPKWFKVDRDLKEQDLVYFKKKDSPISSTWTIGQVDQVIASRDGVVRRAVIKYFNPKENHPQFTDRSVRKIVKLWSLDESCLFDDLGELQKRYDNRSVSGEKDANDDKVEDDGVEAVTGMAQYQQAYLSGECELSCFLASHNGLMIRGSPAVLSSVQGQYSGSAEARQMHGPTYTTLDGFKLDLVALTMSCNLTSLTVQPIGVIEEDQAHHHLVEQEKQAVKLESLHEVIVSTGFYLE